MVILQYNNTEAEKSNKSIDQIWKGKEKYNNLGIILILFNKPMITYGNITELLLSRDKKWQEYDKRTQFYERRHKETTIYRRCQDLVSKDYLVAIGEPAQKKVKYDLTFKGLITLGSMIPNLRGNIASDQRIQNFSVKVDPEGMTYGFFTYFTSQLSKEEFDLLNETAYKLFSKGQEIVYGLIEIGIKKGEINLDSVSSDWLGQWILEKMITIFYSIKRRLRTQISPEIIELIEKNQSELEEIKSAGKIFDKAIKKIIREL